MRRSVLMTLLAVGCVEYDLTKPADDADPASPEDSGGSPTSTDAGTPDADDTGEDPIIEDPPPDTGVAPEPDECEPLEVLDTVEIDESCHTDPVTGPMEVTLEWSMELSLIHI